MMITSTLALVFGLMEIQFTVATVAVSPDPDVTCNSCCQGRDGIHGIPGSNGNHGPVGPRGDAGSPGEVGEPGTKGNKGSDGLVGEQGAKGDHGLKGEQGVGQPGKQGPQGMPGMNGLKGERGEAGECSTRRSAFTAVRNTNFIPSSSFDPLPFEELLFSEEETDFSLSNGTFACTVPGIYVFMFSVLKQSSGSYLYIRLKKNHNVIVAGGVNVAGYLKVSSSAVIPLHYGDQVHLAVRGQVYGGSDHFSSFTGFLLYEI